MDGSHSTSLHGRGACLDFDAAYMLSKVGLQYWGHSSLRIQGTSDTNHAAHAMMSSIIAEGLFALLCPGRVRSTGERTTGGKWRIRRRNRYCTLRQHGRTKMWRRTPAPITTDDASRIMSDRDLGEFDLGLSTRVLHRSQSNVDTYLHRTCGCTSCIYMIVPCCCRVVFNITVRT